MYIGNDLQIAHPSYKIIDDISSGFNGSQTSFALQVSGATPVPFPISTQQVMISVNGVVQEPDPNGSAGFKLLGSNIVFSSAPANGHAFFGVINAGADYVTAGSEFPDGSATAPSFTFQDDQDTGWFRNASGDVGYSSNGAAILNFDGNGLTIAAGKGLTVDTSTLKVDAANNRVGIGSASPTETLHVYQNAADNVNALFEQGTTNSGNLIQFKQTTSGSVARTAYIGHGGDNTGQLMIQNSHNIYLQTGGSNTALTIDSSQNATFAGPIGSGTGPGSYQLQVERASGNEIARFTGANGAYLTLRNATSNEMLLYVPSGDSLKFATNGYANVALTLDSSQNATFAGSVTAGFGVFYQSTGQSSLRIGSGNAGGAALVLDGDSNGDGSGADYAYIKHDTSGNLIIAADDPAGDAELRLHVGNDSEEFRIDSAGRCIVGGGSHIGGSALVVKGGNQNNYSTAGFFSNHTNPTSGTDLAQLRFGSNATGVGATIDIVADADWGTNDFPTKIVFKTCPDGSNSRATALTIDRNKHVTAASYLSDQIGDVRSIPQNATTSAYTLVALDNGKAITNTSGGVTIPNGVFGSGSAVSIINHSGSDITLTQASGLTIYNTADGTTGNRTLAARGMATVWFQATSTAYISGAGLS